MYYILTPHMDDFQRECSKLHLPHFNGHSNRDVVWVHSVERLYGRKINDTDIIIKGEKFSEFTNEEIEQLEMEIVIRKRV